MSIFKVSVSIPDYYYEDVFDQEIFFEDKNPPCFEDVLQAVKCLHDRDSQYPEYIGTWEQVEKTLLQLKIEGKEFPYMSYNAEYVSNVVKEVPGLVSKIGSVSIKKIRPLTFPVTVDSVYNKED